MAQTQAKFSADTTKGCTPVTVNFLDNSAGNIVSWSWDFGNGNKSTKQNPSAVFYKPGTYTVSLVVTDNSGGTSKETKTQYIEVFEVPTADFVPAKTSGCEPLDVPFTNKTKKGSGDIDEVTWDFGDGNTLKSKSGYHQYKHAGTYSVSMLVVDKNKCEDKIKKDNIITVFPVPVANFEADDVYGCKPPHKVKFKNLTNSGGSGFKYSWDFGDGNTSTDENPEHTYTTNGAFTVKLTVTNSDGCVGVKVFNSFINVNPLKVDFKINKFSGCAPLDVSFTNITEPNISGLSYSWELGDGKKAYTPNVSNTYEKPGVYSVKLTVSKGGNCTQTKTYANAITVSPSPEPKMKVSDTTSCKVPFDIELEDIGTGSTNWTWMVDGTPKQVNQKTKITISQFKPHVISLVTSNNYGCKSDTLKKLIQVKPIEVEAKPDTSGCVPMSVLFRNTSDLGNKKMVSQTWDFGDGETETITDPSQRNVRHKYDKDGIYTVTLTVVTDEGCEASTTLTVKVGKKRPPKIDPGIDTLCNASMGSILNKTDVKYKDSLDKIIWKLIPNTGSTSFQDSANKSQFGFKWNFNFEVKEKDTGYYKAILITEDRGCFDTTEYPNRIYILPPVAKIKPLHDTCANDVMILANISKHYDSFYWEFNKKFYYDSIIKVSTEESDVAKIVAFNSTSKCIDSTNFTFKPKNTFSGGFTYRGDYCAPTSFSLRGSATEPYLAYLWTINGKDSLFTRNTSVEFKQPGKYKINYVVTDTSATGGCARAMEIELDITGPTVDGSINGTAACGPVDVELTCNSDPKEFAELYWQIGDDRVNVTKKGTITWELFKPGPNDGKWPITLIGIDSNGCKGSKEFEMEVFGTKNVSLHTTRFKDCEGLKFIFSPVFGTQISDAGWKYNWNLGDGTTKEIKVANHTYKKPGVYVVQLFMTDENNCVTRLQDTINIEDEVLKAKFFADSLIKDCPPLHVSFEDRSTVNKLRKIIKWEWDFGDGTKSQERYPSKLYLTAGNFDVSLKVTDEWGCVDSFKYPGFVLVNGPVGNYVFDKKEGCVPLDVTFEADTTRCSSFTWDFGDGNILSNQLKVTHTYQDTGRFIPLLTLKDTFGCVYTRPPIDTIYVYPLPVPDFGISTPCPGVPTKFSNNSWPVGSLSSTVWDFGDGGSSTDYYPNYLYKQGGKYPVKLSVTTRNGCTKDTIKYVDIRKINADFNTLESEVCVGSTITINDISESDNFITRWEWTINDTMKFTGQQPKLSVNEVGPVKVQLVIEDAIGCTDTLITNSLLKVGDTIAPVPTDLLRVSVVNDYRYLTDYKKSAITDFKSYLIYHNDQLVAEIYDQDSTRYEFGQLNTLHNVYCSRVAVKNACGLISDVAMDSSDCTVEVSAKGEVNQSRINWNPYSGWQDVEKYYIYRQDEGAPDNYFLLDSVDGQTTEYIDTNILCYQKHRYKIRAKELLNNNQYSWSDTCEATPIYINSLPPNELVRATVQHDDYVRIEWLPTPYSKMPIDHYILEKSFDGVKYNVIKNNISSTIFDADDQAVEVDSQSYFYRVRAVDVCKDEAPYSNLAKTILLDADTGKFQRPYLVWSKYEGWDVGVERYEVQRKEEDGSFFSLGFTSSADDTTFYDKQTRLNERPHFCYRVIGYKVPEDGKEQVISISNEDCIDVHSWLYVPNAFSPNNDGLNDYFVTPGWYIKDYHITIYNRWGEKLFESNSLYQSWDGDYKGEVVENEAYLYIIESIGIDNIKRKYKGTVTVIR